MADKKRKRTTRDLRISVRFDAPEAEKIRRAAQREHLLFSTWCRVVILRHLEQENASNGTAA